MFARAVTVAIALCASLAAASPTKRVLGPFDDDVKIHESCRANKTQYDMLVRALDDTKNLTITAKHCMCLHPSEACWTHRLVLHQTSPPMDLQTLFMSVTSARLI
jgi:hypothetical protein